MSRTLATSRKSKRRRQLTLLSPERLASPLVSKAQSEAWTTLVVNLPCDSASYLIQFVRGGLSGKTSPECCSLTKEETSVASSRRWQNSGMGSPTEFWTLDSLESPNDADVCLLSDILETGDVPPQCSLTDHNLKRMKERLVKYTSPTNPLLVALQSCSVGAETRPSNMESKSRLLSVPNKAARESA